MSKFYRLFVAISLIIPSIYSNEIILKNAENKYLHEGYMIKHFNKFSTKNRTIIVRVTDSSPKATNEMSNDVVVRHKQVYNFNFSTFTKLINLDYFSNEILCQSDVIFLIDIVSNNFVISLSKDYRRLVMFVRANSSTNVFFPQEAKSAIILGTPLSVNGTYYKVTPMCFYPLPAYSLLLDKQTAKGQQKTYVYTEYGKDCKAVVLQFIPFEKLRDEMKNQLEYIKSHYLHKVFELLAKDMKFYIIVSSYNHQSAKHGVTNNSFIIDTHHLLKFVFNNFYGLTGGITVEYQNFAESYVYLGYEDVIWVVFNDQYSILRTYLSLKILKVFFGILLVVILIKKIFPFLNRFYFSTESCLLVSWSIFLSISVPKQPTGYFIRIIFLTWTLTSSAITMLYFSQDSNFFERSYFVRYNTQEELLKSNIPLHVFSKEYADIAFSDVKNIKYKVYFEFRGVMTNSDLSFIDYVQRLIDKGEYFAILMDRSVSKRILREKNDCIYYIVREIVFRYPISIHTTSINPHSIKIIKKIKNLMASGVVCKLINEFDLSPNFDPHSVSKINFKYFREVYYQICFTYALAFIIFLIEIAVYKFSSNKRNQTQYIN